MDVASEAWIVLELFSPCRSQQVRYDGVGCPHTVTTSSTALQLLNNVKTNHFILLAQQFTLYLTSQPIHQTDKRRWWKQVFKQRGDDGPIFRASHLIWCCKPGGAVRKLQDSARARPDLSVTRNPAVCWYWMSVIFNSTFKLPVCGKGERGESQALDLSLVRFRKHWLVLWEREFSSSTEMTMGYTLQRLIMLIIDDNLNKEFNACIVNVERGYRKLSHFQHFIE